MEEQRASHISSAEQLEQQVKLILTYCWDCCYYCILLFWIWMLLLMLTLLLLLLLFSFCCRLFD